MALREIRLDGDPILRKKSKKVEEINDRIRQLLDDMVETMNYANGVGIAAPQVGILRRLVIVYDAELGPMKIINPEIVEFEGEEVDIEGCLSVPSRQGTVKRPERIVVKYMDVNGEEETIEASGYLARVFCHEIDHLDGILYTDKAIEMYDNDGDSEDEDDEHEELD